MLVTKDAEKGHGQNSTTHGMVAGLSSTPTLWGRMPMLAARAGGGWREGEGVRRQLVDLL